MAGQLVRSNLAEQLAEQLAMSIEREQLAPGAEIPASASIAETYGVSRTVVREALKLLEARGIIDVANGKRATVKPISSEILLSFFERVTRLESEGYRALLEVREAIETQNARLAARRRSEAELEQLRALVVRMRGSIDDIETFVELDVELHLLISQASRNAVLAHLTESIRDALKATMTEGRLRRTTRRDTELVQELHERLVAEIGRGDAESAAAVMTQMFVDQYRFFLD